jgi:hypothetical protein
MTFFLIAVGRFSQIIFLECRTTPSMISWAFALHLVEAEMNQSGNLSYSGFSTIHLNINPTLA